MMKFVAPITVTDAMNFTTNVPEDDHPLYNSETTYGLGERCILTTGYHRIYESCQAINTGNNPPNNLTGEIPLWRDVSSTNARKVFDGKSRAATTHPGTVQMTMTPGKVVNSLGLVNVAASAVDIVVTHPTRGIVYETDINMIDSSGIHSYYDWFFNEPVKKPNVVLLNLPSYTDLTVSVTISNGDNLVEIGEWVLGTQADIGMLLYDYSRSFTDYSTVTRDDTGDAKIVRRSYSDSITYPVRIERSKLYAVDRKLKSYRARGLLFIGTSDKQETIVYGFIKDLFETVKGEHKSLCSLEIEELN